MARVSFPDKCSIVGGYILMVGELQRIKLGMIHVYIVGLHFYVVYMYCM